MDYDQGMKVISLLREIAVILKRIEEKLEQGNRVKP